MSGGKSEMLRAAKEAALCAGQTVIVCTLQSTTKWKRHWRNGRYFDVAEDLKPREQSPSPFIHYDEVAHFDDLPK